MYRDKRYDIPTSGYRDAIFDFPLIHKSGSHRSSLATLPEPKNMGFAYVISLQSCTGWDLHYIISTSGNGLHRRLPTNAQVGLLLQ